MTKKNFTVNQGDTFTKIVRWEIDPVVFKMVTSITKAAPAVVGATGHGLVTGWRAAFVSMTGMPEINAKRDPPDDADYHIVKMLTVDTLELTGFSTAGFNAAGTNGYLRYNTPQDLANFTARMEIKDKIGGAIVLTLTDANGGIVIDNTFKKITIVMTAAQTAALKNRTMVYDLEMVNADGTITKLISGKLTLSLEITT